MIVNISVGLRAEKYKYYCDISISWEFFVDAITNKFENENHIHIVKEYKKVQQCNTDIRWYYWNSINLAFLPYNFECPYCVADNGLHLGNLITDLLLQNLSVSISAYENINTHGMHTISSTHIFTYTHITCMVSADPRKVPSFIFVESKFSL